MAGFPDILNYFRHNGVFGTGKTPNFRDQRHCDKWFTSYKRISKQKRFSEKHQTGVQTGIRVENSLDQDQVRRFVRSDLGLNCLQMLSADNTRRHSHILLSAGSTHPNITEKLLTRFNSLQHIFPHCKITSMQRVFLFVCK